LFRFFLVAGGILQRHQQLHAGRLAEMRPRLIFVSRFALARRCQLRRRRRRLGRGDVVVGQARYQPFIPLARTLREESIAASGGVVEDVVLRTDAHRLQFAGEPRGKHQIRRARLHQNQTGNSESSLVTKPQMNVFSSSNTWIRQKSNQHWSWTIKTIYPLSLVRIALAIRWPVVRSVVRSAPAPTAVSDPVRIIADDQLASITRSGGMDAETLPLLREVEMVRATRIQLAAADITVWAADEKVTLATGSLRELTIAAFIRFIVDIARNTSTRQSVRSILFIYFLPVVCIHSADGGCDWVFRKLIWIWDKPLALINTVID